MTDANEHILFEYKRPHIVFVAIQVIVFGKLCWLWGPMRMSTLGFERSNALSTNCSDLDDFFQAQ